MAKRRELRSYSLTFFRADAYDNRGNAVAAAAIARERGAVPARRSGRVFGVVSTWRGPDWYGLDHVCEWET